MDICECIKQSDGQRCTYRAKPGSPLCGVHKSCKKRMLKSPIAPVKTEPLQPVKPKTPIASNHYNLLSLKRLLRRSAY